jgi:putative N6-adenine-specific DNA methylase
MIHRLGVPSDLVFASTTVGLEEALADELSAFGHVEERVRGGVLLRGDEGLHEEVCLRSRVANHVLVRLGSARGTDPAAIARGLKEVPIQRAVAKGQAIALDASGAPSRARDLERLAKDAWGERPGSPAAELRLRWTGEGCELSADASGDILHKRGYRQEISRAPLRETIAAGILRIAGYRGEEPLWDPMCGSGTLAIEAAWIALRRAPGLDRDFAFTRWPSFDRAAWDRRLARARQEQRDFAPPIAATDLNAGSVGVARRNARRAGVVSQLKLERGDVRTAVPPSSPGLVVANLPYGKRVAADDQLLKELGAALRRWRGWRFALLVHERARVEELGVVVDRRAQIDNGGIPCALLLGSIAG